MNIIYRDKDILVLNKEAGMLVQGDITGRDSIYSKLKTEYNLPGSLEKERQARFIGIVHRLDYLVSGIIIIALSRRSAKMLSEQFREKSVSKEYYAVVENINIPAFDEKEQLTLYCRREGYKTVIEKEMNEDSKELSIKITALRSNKRFSLLKVMPITGRKHQIRAVLAFFKIPVIGDKKYGSRIPFKKDSIALHCRRTVIYHPFKNKDMEFIAELPDYWEVFSDITGENF